MKTLKHQDNKQAKKGNNSSYPFASIRKSIVEITHLNCPYDTDHFEQTATDEWRPEKHLQTLYTPFHKRIAMKTSGGKGKFLQNIFKVNYLVQ